MRLSGDDLLLSPTDLYHFLACEHRTALDLYSARGRIDPPDSPPRPDAELVARKGNEHEDAYRRRLIEQGLEVFDVVAPGQSPWEVPAAIERTEQAMRAGVDVVYQAAFVDDGWQGYADFLLRTDEPSPGLGGFSYEVADTKLAKHPKPYYILQLCFYSEQVARIQGLMPKHMHVVLGTSEQRTFLYDDFAAYVRRVRAHFGDVLAAFEDGAEPPYPYPVEHCSRCDWIERCERKREADDHLSRVAMMRRDQVGKLEAAGIPTLRTLAAQVPPLQVAGIGDDALESLRDQAALQAHYDATGELRLNLLPLEDGRGFQRLPEPSRGDVFFDMEGDPFWGIDGLEYLFGAVTADGGGDPASSFTAFWGHDRAGERHAFEGFVDWVTARLAADPEMHIYHYAPYEPNALKKLMSRHGTREAEVDELLRRRVFVDLYAVVRQSMRISEPRYSIKNVEAFYRDGRDTEVTEGGGSIVAYEEYLDTRDPAKLDALADYNRDDCVSTLELRNWLLAQREDARREYDAVLAPRDARPASRLSPERLEREEEIARLRAALTVDLPDDEDAPLDFEQRARRLLADLLDYHRRESKPGFWAYFERLQRTPAELEADSDAIGSLAPAPDVERGEQDLSWLYPLRFPDQQHKLRPGQAVDPATGGRVTVVEVDDTRALVWIKRAKKSDVEPLPRALIPGQPLPTTAQRAALERLARRVIEHGLEPNGSLDALTDLLLGRPPRIAGLPEGSPLASGDLERLESQVAALDSSALFIQGPPGSGKTHTGARLIVDLMRRGRRVGVVATGHKAIANLLDKVEEAATAEGFSFRGLKKSSGEGTESHYEGAFIESSSTNADFEPPEDDIQLIAGTAWLFAREGLSGAGDTLFVDEAGQVSLADALAIGGAARNLVLLGDPQQLAHVVQGVHPRGSSASVLEHLLGDDETVAPERGVFLGTTYRMHPDVCSFISDTMYQGRLEAEERCATQTLTSPGLSGTGVRYLAVEHEDNRQSSPEEAERIAIEVERLLDGGAVVSCDGDERALTPADILVVAPYNMQVRAIATRLDGKARVGTVDKFQGQEAPVVVFSMASSSGEDVPRGLDFLFSRNRLNVAISRAQCLAVLVCSPRLLHARCSSVEQMRLVNALCRLVELT